MKLGLGLSLTGMQRRRDTPAFIFANGEPGVWLDPSDPATVFSDTAGTTQAGIGDPVALVLDKSGNGNHATQPTLASRPILREADGLRYLEFDGVDDFLATPTITPGTDKAQVFAGVRKLNDNVYRWICALRSTRDTNGTFTVSASVFADLGEAGGRRNWAMEVRGTIRAVRATTASFAAPLTSVLMAQIHNDGSDNIGSLRVDGQPSALAPATIDSGSATNFANAVFDIGGDTVNSNFINGNIYSLLVRFGPNLDTATIERTERYVAKRTGVSL